MTVTWLTSHDLGAATDTPVFQVTSGLSLT